MTVNEIHSQASKNNAARHISLSAVLFCSLLSAVLPVCAAAQVQEVCDVTCTPDPSSSSYPGTVAARPKILNARGYSSPVVARTGLRAAAAAASSDSTVIGSQSYDYTIPILALPGRAGSNLALNLYYNSRVWGVDTVDSTVTFNPDRDFPSYGFRLDFGYIETTNGIIVTDPDGTKHTLTYPNGTNLLDSTDGTYMEFNTQTNTLTYRLGTTIQYQSFPSDASLLRPVLIEDGNGNYISITYLSGHDQLISTITDTVGRVINFNYMQDGSNRLASISQNLHPSGVRTYATFTWGTLYGNGYQWYNFSGLTVAGAPDLSTPLNVITQCTYANGTGYSFTYGDWGIINKITSLSSNGTTRSYIGYNYPLASAGALTDAPAYTQQTISPDGTTTNASTWTYSTTKQGVGVVTSMAVTDPNGNVTTTNLDPTTQFVTSTSIQGNTGKTFQSVSYTWTTSEGGSVPATIQTTNDAGQVSSVQYSYDQTWASYGQPTTIQEVDFDGTVKRSTLTAYNTAANEAAPYIARHILGLPFNTIVAGASGVTSRTDYQYDTYGNTGGLTSVSGASGHDDVNYGASFGTRGNLTYMIRWSAVDVHNNGVNPSIQSFAGYNTLGNVLTTSVDCCVQTQFNFSSTTQYSLPDSVVRGPSGGPQFTTSYTYNIDSGLPLTSTNENGQATQYQYDPMGRALQVTLPPQSGTQVNVNSSYDDADASPSITNSNSANSAVTVTTFDGLGHVVEVDDKNGTTTISSVKTGYDKLWETVQVSNPYGPSDPVLNTLYSYDPLGRRTQITPPSGGSTQYQYSGNVVTVTDPAGNQRKSYRDALGRLIEVDEPGESFAGVKAQGSVDIGQIKGIPTPSKGSVTIGTSTNGEQCSNGVCQTGTVSVSFNNSAETDSASFGSGDTTSTVASKLAAAINNCGHSPCYATAKSSGATVNFTSTATGTGANWQVAASYSEAGSQFWSTGTTQSPNSFTASQSCASYMIGGSSQGPGCLSSPSGRFVLQLTSDGNLVLYDKSSGNPGTILWQSNTGNHTGVFMTLKTNGVLGVGFTCCGGRTQTALINTAGPTSAYYLTVQNDGNAVIYQGFPQPSFTPSPTQQTMTGGTNAGIVDHGTVTMTAGSFTTSAIPYGPGTANTTGSQVAAALANALSVSGSGVTATSSGTVITVTDTTPGVAGNSISVSVQPTSGDPADFPIPSFSVGSFNLSGGIDPYSSGFAHPYVSTYTYDEAGNLLTVSEAAGNVNDQQVPGQPRSYIYDSLSRLTSSTTPESGTVTTYYTTASGGTCAANILLPCRVQDARGVVRTFTYDGINRPATVGFSDGTPTVSYQYDGGGAAAFALTRLTNITEGSNSQTFTYDSFGRTASLTQVIDGNSYSIQYSYTPSSELASVTYPTGRVVSQSVDSIGRLSSVSDSSGTYLSNFTFNAAGQPLGFTLGSGVQGAFTYNDHTQLSTIRYFQNGSANDILNLSFDYGSTNNGQIQTMHYFTSPGTEDPTKSEYFAYDPTLRLASAHTGTVNGTQGTWSLAWTYDRLGNRLSQTLVGGNVSIGQPNFTVNPSTNQITNPGFTYDAAGNLTSDGTNTYAFDATNRLTQINGGSAVYTYFGPLRIKKVTGTTTTVYIYSGSKPIVEYTNGAVSKEYIYAGTALVATVSGSSTTYHHPDHLSNRAETDSSGNVLRTYGHFPFGETWYETGTPDKWKFTTYERDANSGETGFDYAHFRYYASTQGRFIGADHLSGSCRAPQSLNKYSYVMNDPVNATDPEGLAIKTCVLAIGINTKAGSQDSTLAAHGIQPGIYTYSGGKLHGILSVLNQDLSFLHPAGRTVAGADGINALAPQILLGYSGGAAIIANAVKFHQIDQDVWDEVQATIYISPGTGVSLPAGSGADSLALEEYIVHGHGAADLGTTSLQWFFYGNRGKALPCTHGDLSCFLNNLAGLLHALGCSPDVAVEPAGEPVPIMPIPLIPLPDPPPDDDCGDDCGGPPNPNGPVLVCRSGGTDCFNDGGGDPPPFIDPGDDPGLDPLDDCCDLTSAIERNDGQLRQADHAPPARRWQTLLEIYWDGGAELRRKSPPFPKETASGPVRLV